MAADIGVAVGAPVPGPVHETAGVAPALDLVRATAVAVVTARRVVLAASRRAHLEVTRVPVLAREADHAQASPPRGTTNILRPHRRRNHCYRRPNRFCRPQ